MTRALLVVVLAGLLLPACHFFLPGAPCDRPEHCAADERCLTGVCVVVEDAGPGGVEPHRDSGAPLDGGDDVDSGRPDGGAAHDAGPFDAGPLDAGPDDDAGATDAGSALTDAGPPDAGPPDAGPLDAGPFDGGPLDAGPPDAGPPDAGPPDAGPPDAGPPDAGSGCVVYGCPGGGVCTVDGCRYTRVFAVEHPLDDGYEDDALAKRTRALYPWMSLYAAGATGGFRFVLPDVPAGASVESAVLSLFVDSQGEDDIDADVRVEDSATAARLTDDDVALEITNRTTVPGVVAWWAPNIIGSPDDVNLPGGRASSPELKALVQRALERQDWQPGGAIFFIVVARSDSFFEFRQVDHSSAEPGELHLTYVVP